MLKVNSADLIKAVNIINLVPSRAGIPSSEFIQLRSSGKKMSLALSADVFGEVSVECSSKDKWEAYADRASFVPFVNASRESGSKAAFVFKYKDGSVTVKCGRRKGVFNKLSVVSGYSAIEDMAGNKVSLSKEQRRAITLAAKYATPDPTIAHLNCVYIERSGAVLASNERAAVRIKARAVGAAMPIPLGVLTTLDHESVTALVLGKKLAKIGFDVGYLCQTVNQKAASQFPNKSINSSFESAASYPRRFKVNAVNFIDAMLRLYEYSSVVIKRDAVVKITGVKGESLLRLSCKVPQGQFSETVTLKTELKTDVKAEWLLEVLVPLTLMRKKVESFSVFYEEGGKTPYYITAPEFELLVARRLA